MSTLVKKYIYTINKNKYENKTNLQPLHDRIVDLKILQFRVD
jgi:hypothetical protein